MYVVLEYAGRKLGHTCWLCRCDCGNTREVPATSLVTGRSRCCGCIGRQGIIERNKASARHGLSHTPTHHSWIALRDRCLNPDCKDFPRYGGRGITVCERWLSFDNFLADMGVCPPGHTIDRINPNGDYSPENCRWATQTEQQRNRRNNRLLTFNGKTQCTSAWAEEIGLSKPALCRRLRRGWSVEAALQPPLR